MQHTENVTPRLERLIAFDRQFEGEVSDLIYPPRFKRIKNLNRKESKQKRVLHQRVKVDIELQLIKSRVNS